MNESKISTEAGCESKPSRPVRVVVLQHQLVRGEEQSFLLEITSRLNSVSVELDMSRVERLDAAGVAALVQLYALAHDLGRSLTIISASRHVSEILTLVGLGWLLESRIAIRTPQSGPRSGIVAA